jgi:hypothetical protein
MKKTIVSDASLKFRKRNDDRHGLVMNELLRLSNLKQRIINSEVNSNIKEIITIGDIEADIFELESELDQILATKTQILASRSRVGREIQ